MKINLCLLLLIILVNLSEASLQGRAKLDSLVKEYEKSEDKKNIDLLYNLAKDYNLYNLDSSQLFLREYFKLELDDFERAKGNYFMATYFKKKNDYNKADSIYRETLGYLSKDSTNQAFLITNIYKSLGYLYKVKGEFKKSIKVLDSALEANQLNEPEDRKIRSEANILNSIGESYIFLEDLEKADSLYQISLSKLQMLSKQDNSKNFYTLNSLMNLYIKLGNLQKRRYQIKKEIEYFNNALKIAKDLERDEDLFYVYQKLGSSYLKIRLFDKSLEYYYEALTFFKGNNGVEDQLDIYSNIIQIYSAIGKHDSALVALNISDSLIHLSARPIK